MAISKPAVPYDTIANAACLAGCLAVCAFLCMCVCLCLSLCACVCGSVNVLFGMHIGLCNIKQTRSYSPCLPASRSGRLSKCHTTEIHISLKCGSTFAAAIVASTTTLTWSKSAHIYPTRPSCCTSNRIYLVVM